MCNTSCLKHRKVLGVLAGDESVHAAFVRAAVGAPEAVAALPAAVAKKAMTVSGATTPVANMLNALVAREAMALEECSPSTAVANTSKAPVAREAKASKECSPVTTDVSVPTEVVAAPAPVVKAPGTFHPTSVVVEILGTEMGDRGHSCEEHSKCSEVMAKDLVVGLWNVQIWVERREETVIAAYWVTEGVDCCHVGFLPCHMVRHAAGYNGVVVQDTRVFNADQTCCNTVECHTFHKNKKCCLAAMIAW
jgi:hypothetical protein